MTESTVLFWAICFSNRYTLLRTAGVVIGRLLATTIMLYGVTHPGPITREISSKSMRAFEFAGSWLMSVGPVFSASAGTAITASSAVAAKPA